MVKADTYVKEKKARLFANVFKKTPKSPDLSGIMQIGGLVYFAALWKNISRKNGQEIFRGLLHKDGERGRNLGSLNVYKNKWYMEGVDGKLPFYYGRLTMGNKIYKVQFWANKGKNVKEYYGGVIRDLINI